MSSSRTRAARSKRTKDSLIEELETLEAKLKDTDAPDPIAQTVAKESVVKTREAVKGLSVDTIVTKGATFSLEVQRTVSQLTEQAVQKAEELSLLEKAIADDTAELERLYDLDVVSASTLALIEAHTASKLELEKQASLARQAWNEESQAHQKLITQRNADLEAARRRDQAEYDYRTAQERARATEEFQHGLSIQARDQAEQAAQATKSINERLAVITAQEKELSVFKARIEGLDAELKSKTDAAVAIATNSLKKDLLGGFALEKKDLDLQLQLQVQKNAALESASVRMAEEIQKLHTQLDAARDQVKDIAIKSVEGASGQTALAKVMELNKENGQQTRKS